MTEITGVGEVPKEQFYPVETVKAWFAKRAYPRALEPIPQQVDETSLTKSMDDYLVWLKTKNAGDYAVEPGRAALWGHVTSNKGIEQLSQTGVMRSAKRVLVEGGSIGHGGGGKIRQLIEWKHISPDSKLADLNPETQREILRLVDDDIAGTVGHLSADYSAPASVPPYQRQGIWKNPENHFAVIYPTNHLLMTYGRLYRPGQRNPLDTWDSRQLQWNSDYIRFMPILTNLHQYVDGLDFEYQLVTDTENGTQISLEHGLLIVPESMQKKVEELFLSKAEKTLPIIGFSLKFNSIDQAAGWLTNTPEGRYLFQRATGVDILKEILKPVRQQDIQLFLKMLEGKRKYLIKQRSSIQESIHVKKHITRKSINEAEPGTLRNALGRIDPQIGYFTDVIRDMKEVFKIEERQS